MSKHTTSERAEALARLRDWIKPGDTVYTIVESVSRSGMSRIIRTVLPSVDDGRVTFTHPNWAISVVTGYSQTKRGDGLRVGGCGMDMGFALVYALSHHLYPEYDCLGESCPSPDHQNARRRNTCDCGHEDYNHRTEHMAMSNIPYKGACEQLECACVKFRKIPNVDHRGPGVRHRDGYALRQAWL